MGTTTRGRQDRTPSLDGALEICCTWTPHAHARFERPGHALTGVRDRTGADKRAGSGYDFAHAVVDDHSRLAYVELLGDERAATVTAFFARALDWFEARGIHAKRVMTDNAWVYVKNQSLRELLTTREIKHLRTQAYRPQTNGKVERFHQTMAQEWAYSLTYCSHHHRNQALPHWLDACVQRAVLGGRLDVFCGPADHGHIGSRERCRAVSCA